MYSFVLRLDYDSDWQSSFGIWALPQYWHQFGVVHYYYNSSQYYVAVSKLSEVRLVKQARWEHILNPMMPPNLNSVQQSKGFYLKKFTSNCIFGSFKLFYSSKMDFWPFLKLEKMEFGQKQICEIDLFDFTSFLAWTFLNFLSQYISMYFA